MRKSAIIVLLALLANTSFLVSQEVCETPEESIEDLNSITKCVIEKTEKVNSSGKKTKKLSVKISSSKRYLKRRIKNKTAVSGLGGINTSGINAIDSEAKISESLNIKETGANNISILMAKISKEQLKNASSFEDVDQIPLFKACKVSNKEANSNCFNENMMAHIQNHFQYPKDAIINKVEGNVWVRFVIDEEGNVTNLKTLGPKNGETLKDEAIRVISKLTSFTPAMKKGKKVLAKYGFPINFSLQD